MSIEDATEDIASLKEIEDACDPNYGAYVNILEEMREINGNSHAIFPYLWSLLWLKVKSYPSLIRKYSRVEIFVDPLQGNTAVNEKKILK